MGDQDHSPLELKQTLFKHIQRTYIEIVGRLVEQEYICRLTHKIGDQDPRLFSAVMGWAAGFFVLDVGLVSDDDPKPQVLLEYGTHDPTFPFERVALPMRDRLRRAGYQLEFRVDQGGRHWPSGEFQPEALDWFFSEPWEPRT